MCHRANLLSQGDKTIGHLLNQLTLLKLNMNQHSGGEGGGRGRHRGAKRESAAFFLPTVHTDPVTDMPDVRSRLLVINMSRIRGL